MHTCLQFITIAESTADIITANQIKSYINYPRNFLIEATGYFLLFFITWYDNTIV